MSRVLVAMSGGVDSSVAAALLRDEGHDVTGVTLRLWGGESDSGCCSVSDVEDARRVASQLDIPHYVFNFGDAFDASVVAPYVADYAAGRTPNPCVECNRHVKWGRCFERAMALGFDALATGHHARVTRRDGRAALQRGADAAKDQSYVLGMLSSSQLERTLLPVGAMTKSEVRDRARALGLRTAAKPESMDVCFITKGGRARFLEARLSAQPGVVVDTDGTEVGRHGGVHLVTIGQRRGLDVAVGERRYVVDVDAPTATVTIGARADLLRDTIELDRLTVGDRLEPGSRVRAQTSAHGTAIPATFDGGALRLDSPTPRVAPGQLVVMYADDMPDIVVGSGVAR